jgi:DNA-binding MarR family transcriptional regulator
MADDVISDHDYEALAAFRYALRQFVAFSETEAKAAGLTPRQHQALLAIKGTPSAPDGLAISQLADRLLIRHNSAVELVDRLAEADLVRRHPDPADGRRMLVTLTERSETVLRGLTAAHLRELRANRSSLLGLLRRF